MKILRRKRFRIVLVVLAALLCLVVFAQYRQRENQRRDHPERDWRAQVEKRASDLERQMNQRRGIPEQWKRWMKYEAGRLRYYLSKNLNPNELTGPVFTRGFAGVGSVLLIPLLIAVFGADLVSSEFAEGTITLLLTRPVARWKVLLSKVVAMMLFTTLTLLAAFFLAWGISGIAFGWSGWDAPMLTGFRLAGSSLRPRLRPHGRAHGRPVAGHVCRVGPRLVRGPRGRARSRCCCRSSSGRPRPRWAR